MFFSIYQGDETKLHFIKYKGYWLGFESEPYLVKDTENGYYFVDALNCHISEVVRFNNKPDWV